MSDFDEVIDKIVKQISSSTVNAIFGETRLFDDKAIIPVGKIAYGWGGGGGKAEKETAKEEGEEENQGMGLGMGTKIQPVGYVLISKDRVLFQPIFEIGPIMLACTIFGGLLFLKLFKFKMMGKHYHKHLATDSHQKPFSKHMHLFKK